MRALDEFNPHRGSLALLDAVSRPFGLSAGLVLVFAMTFLSTCHAVGRLARVVWPDLGRAAGWVAVCLFLAAKAGNIGTNHLFEAMVLDRQVALALGWLAIAEAVARPTTGWWTSSAAVALATVVHPSVGLQLALVLGSSWLIWAMLGTASRREHRDRGARRGIARRRRSAGTIDQSPPGIDALRRAARLALLGPEHRAAEPPAHASAPLAMAAVARVVQLSGAGGDADRPVVADRRFLRYRARGRAMAIVDHARRDRGRARGRLVRDRGAAPGPGDDLPAVPDGHCGPRSGVSPGLAARVDALAIRDPARPCARGRPGGGIPGRLAARRRGVERAGRVRRRGDPPHSPVRTDPSDCRAGRLLAHDRPRTQLPRASRHRVGTRPLDRRARSGSGHRGPGA